MELAALVKALPEFYQPIYAHAEYDDRPLRECKDRLPVIQKIYGDLSKSLGRPLRVLDLGCAQGFFCLNLASLGADVTGVDFRGENVRLCQFLAGEHPDFKAHFFRARIEEFLPTVKAGEYDLILCLSILHNISKYLGVRKIQELMQELSGKICGGIFEFATESVHKAYIPADYRDFLPGFPFIRELAHSSHRANSRIKRPICFASAAYVHFDDLGALKADRISYNVHPYLRRQDLVHFHCGDKFIKFFYIKTQGSLIKARQEIDFLKKFGGQKGLPRLLTIWAEESEHGTRVFIVRTKLEGVSLSEKISSGAKIDRWDVIKQALQWMVFLEQRGYYHGDIQTPNFVCGSDGKLYPIDYEEIRREPIVLIWPYKVRLLFLIFMNAVLDSRLEQRHFHREVRLLTRLKRHLSARQYEQIAAITESEKFFARLQEILFQAETQTETKASCDLRDLELLSVERFLDDVSVRLKENQTRFGQVNADMTKLNAYVNELIQIVATQQSRIEQLEKILQEKH